MKPIDLVDHPPHYTKDGGIECIQAIKAALNDDEYRGYLKGNIIKYAWRERHKNRLQDVMKLSWYAKELQEHLRTCLTLVEQQ